MLPQNKHNRLLWKEAQNIKRRHPERSRYLMDPDTEFIETSRIMFIAIFNDAGDIYVLNSIYSKHKYHQILQRRALITSRKRLCE